MINGILPLLLLQQICYECIPITPDPPPAPPYGPPVTITYTTFIPLNHVRLTWPIDNWFYEADNQGTYLPSSIVPPPPGSTFRVQQKVIVRTGLGIVPPPIANSAVSRLFKRNDPTTNLTTSGTCYRKNCPECPSYPPPWFNSITFDGECLIPSAADQGSGLALNMQSVVAELVTAGHTTTTSNHVTVRLKGAPVIGISLNQAVGLLSPHIDWDVTITLTRDSTSGVTTYQILGAHDGFPYHDIRIGSTVVHTHDPVPNDTPIDLYDPVDEGVIAYGTL